MKASFRASVWKGLCVLQFAIIVALLLTIAGPVRDRVHASFFEGVQEGRIEAQAEVPSSDTATPPSRRQPNGAPPQPSASATVEYKDFVSIILTALGVMIAILAAIFAIAAIWGWGTLEREVLKAAVERAENAALKEAGAVAERVAIKVATTLIDQKVNEDDSGDYGEAAGGNGNAG